MPIDRVRLVHDWLAAAEFTAKMIGCSPSAIVAQAALETGWGAAAIGNNIFGIRADSSWKGKVQYITTREVINGQSEIQHGQGFRDYDTVADSFADHFNFLKVNSRYAAAGVFDPGNIKSDQEYFEALQRAGYATDPNYANALLGVQHAVEQIAGLPVKPPAPRTIFIGDYGDDVRALQAELATHGYYAGPVDGRFGEETKTAVIAAQRALFPNEPGEWDGIVGDKTKKRLGITV
jgi:hypothetical protein